MDGYASDNSVGSSDNASSDGSDRVFDIWKIHKRRFWMMKIFLVAMNPKATTKLRTLRTIKTTKEFF
jgi:hypothetical protein